MTSPHPVKSLKTRLLDRSLLARFAKFGLVGLSGVFVNWGVFDLFYRLLFSALADVDLRLVSSNIAGIVVSIFTNFLLNDRWTWGDRNKGRTPDWFRRLGKYYVAASAAAGVQVLVTWVSFRVVWDRLDLVVWGYDFDPTFSLFTGIGCGMFLNFVASHLWAFRDAEDDDE